MLDEYLKVAYAQQLKKDGQAELEGLLSKLPPEELRKLADGTPIAQAYVHLEKKAFLGDAPKAAGCDDSFLDRFKGTPLFDQALALENEEVQADMLQQQRDEERRQEGDVWQMRDKIRLKKRLLEIELAKQEAGGAAAAVPGEPAQGAGAPGPVPSEGVQDSSQGLGGGVAKVGGVKTSAEKVAFADALGRELARQEFSKAASARALTEIGTRAGAVMTKVALDWGGLAKTVGGMAMKKPALAGAALGAGVGALGGAASAGPGNRLGGALGGAALGGAAGAGAGHIAGGGGGALGQQVRSGASSALGKLRGMVGGGPSPGGQLQIPGV